MNRKGQPSLNHKNTLAFIQVCVQRHLSDRQFVAGIKYIGAQNSIRNTSCTHSMFFAAGTTVSPERELGPGKAYGDREITAITVLLI